MKNKIEKYFQDVSRNFQLLEKQANNIEKAIKLIITSLENQKRLYFVVTVVQLTHSIYLQN